MWRQLRDGTEFALLDFASQYNDLAYEFKHVRNGSPSWFGGGKQTRSQVLDLGCMELRSLCFAGLGSLAEVDGFVAWPSPRSSSLRGSAV